MAETLRARAERIEATHRRELIRDLVGVVGIVCEELERRGRPLVEAERVHFHRLVLRAVDHVLELL